MLSAGSRLMSALLPRFTGAASIQLSTPSTANALGVPQLDHTPGGGGGRGGGYGDRYLGGVS